MSRTRREFIGSKLVVDSQPVESAFQVRPNQGLRGQIADAIRQERLAEALAGGQAETFAEADDFDVGDDYDPSSEYEEQFEPDETVDDELDRRIGDSIKRVFQGFGIKFPEAAETEPSPPPEGGGEGGGAQSSSPGP